MAHSSSQLSANPTSNLFLKQVLTVDSAVSLAGGALHVAASSGLQGLTGIASGLYLATGLFLLLFGVLVGLRHPPSALVWILISGNVGWALACVALVVQPPGSYTALGLGYLVFNALWVVLMASLEFAGLQRRHRVITVMA